MGENYNRENYKTFFFAWYNMKLDPSATWTINCDDLYWIFFQQNNSLLREKSLKEFNKNTWPQILQEIPKHAQRRKEFMVIFPQLFLISNTATNLILLYYRNSDDRGLRMLNVITKLTISLKFISDSVKINRKLSCFILMTQTFKNSLG